MDILDMFGKSLDGNDGDKRMPSIGFEITTEDDDLVQHAYKCGYRHFVFGPETGHVIATAMRMWARVNPYINDDTFLTLKMPVIADRYQGAQHTLLRVLSQLKANKLDMVLLYNNDPHSSDTSAWSSKWMELESLYNRGMVQSIGLLANSTDEILQVYKRCRLQPNVITYPLSSTQASLPSDVLTIQNCCNKHRVKQCISMDMDSVMENGLMKQYTTKTPKVICRALMQNNIPYIISSNNLSTIEKCLQVFGFALSNETTKDILTELGLRNHYNHRQVLNTTT